MDRSPRFKHVVLTQYFTRSIEDPGDLGRRLGNIAEWLENRLVLFKRYCLPSVMAQSNQDFTWLLYFDETTPEAYLRRIRDLIAGHDNFKIRLGRLFTPEIQAMDVRA